MTNRQSVFLKDDACEIFIFPLLCGDPRTLPETTMDDVDDDSSNKEILPS